MPFLMIGEQQKQVVNVRSIFTLPLLFHFSARMMPEPHESRWPFDYIPKTHQTTDTGRPWTRPKALSQAFEEDLINGVQSTTITAIMAHQYGFVNTSSRCSVITMNIVCAEVSVAWTLKASDTFLIP